MSLLMPEETQEFELSKNGDIAKSPEYSVSFIDRSVPNSIQDVREVIGSLESELSAGRNVVVHCRQGIGPSGLIAVMLLVQKGHRLEGAIALVSKARGRAVPETEEQLAWLRSLASRHD